MRFFPLTFCCLQIISLLASCKPRIASQPNATKSTGSGTINPTPAAEFDWEAEVNERDVNQWRFEFELRPPFKFQSWAGWSAIASDIYVYGAPLGGPNRLVPDGIPSCYLEDFRSDGELEFTEPTSFFATRIFVYSDGLSDIPLRTRDIVFTLHGEYGLIDLHCGISGLNVRRLRWADIAETFSGRDFLVHLATNAVIIRPRVRD